jgi:hypothetical protein
METTDEFLKKMVSVGTLGYSIEKVINVLDIEDVEWFMKEFYDKSSRIHSAYQKGKDKADFKIDLKLFELAQQGDIEAFKIYERRKEEQTNIEQRNSRLHDL